MTTWVYDDEQLHNTAQDIKYFSLVLVVVFKSFLFTFGKHYIIKQRQNRHGGLVAKASAS